MAEEVQLILTHARTHAHTHIHTHTHTHTLTHTHWTLSGCSDLPNRDMWKLFFMFYDLCVSSHVLVGFGCRNVSTRWIHAHRW